MNKRPSLLIDNTATGTHNPFRIGKLKKRVAVLHGVAAHAALAQHRRRHPKQQANEMCVMHVQINQRATDSSWIVEVLKPQWVGDYPAKLPAEELAVLA